MVLSYAFLQAFGSKDVAFRRLRSCGINRLDFGSVLQTNNIHINTYAAGETTQTLPALLAAGIDVPGSLLRQPLSSLSYLLKYGMIWSLCHISESDAVDVTKRVNRTRTQK